MAPAASTVRVALLMCYVCTAAGVKWTKCPPQVALSPRLPSLPLVRRIDPARPAVREARCVYSSSLLTRLLLPDKIKGDKGWKVRDKGTHKGKGCG